MVCIELCRIGYSFRPLKAAKAVISRFEPKTSLNTPIAHVQNISISLAVVKVEVMVVIVIIVAIEAVTTVDAGVYIAQQ